MSLGPSSRANAPKPGGSSGAQSPPTNNRAPSPTGSCGLRGKPGRPLQGRVSGLKPQASRASQLRAGPLEPSRPSEASQKQPIPRNNKVSGQTQPKLAPTGSWSGLEASSQDSISRKQGALSQTRTQTLHPSSLA